jgi:hypothetical protein
VITTPGLTFTVDAECVLVVPGRERVRWVVGPPSSTGLSGREVTINRMA